MHRRPGVSGAMSRCSSLNSHCLGGQLEPNLHKSNKISPNRWTRPHRAWWIRTVGKRPALQYQEEGASRMCAQQGDEDSAGKRSAGRNSTLLLWRGGRDLLDHTQRWVHRKKMIHVQSNLYCARFQGRVVGLNPACRGRYLEAGRLKGKGMK